MKWAKTCDILPTQGPLQGRIAEHIGLVRIYYDVYDHTYSRFAFWSPLSCHRGSFVWRCCHSVACLLPCMSVPAPWVGAPPVFLLCVVRLRGDGSSTSGTTHCTVRSTTFGPRCILASCSDTSTSCSSQLVYARVVLWFPRM